MNKITIDHTLAAKLIILSEGAELCDDAGQVVGFFTPIVPPSQYDKVEVPFTEKELDRFEHEKGGRPLEDILQGLDEQS